MHGCNQYVTIWNRWRDPENNQADDKLYRRIIPVMCKYTTKTVRNATPEGGIVASTQMVVVPPSEMYTPPNEWADMDEVNREKYFTFQVGDMVALGAVLWDVTGIKPWRETDIRNKLRPNVFTIKVIRDNTHVAHGRHFKLEGS